MEGPHDAQLFSREILEQYLCIEIISMDIMEVNYIRFYTVDEFYKLLRTVSRAEAMVAE